MTCIVGIIHKDTIYMGADSAGVSGLNVTVRKDVKIFRVDEFLIGCTSSFRMIQILRFAFVPPKIHPDTDIYKYMCTEFIDAMRSAFKKGGFISIKDSVEEGGTFLVGYKNRLFTIHDDFQVGESSDWFSAVGCGESFAKGALLVSNRKDDPKSIVTTALKTAVHLSGGVRPPFIILSTNK